MPLRIDDTISVEKECSYSLMQAFDLIGALSMHTW